MQEATTVSSAARRSIGPPQRKTSMIPGATSPLVRPLVGEPTEAPTAGPYDSTTRTQHRTAVAATALRPGRRTSRRAIRPQRHTLTPRRSGTTGPTPRRRATRPGTWDSDPAGTATTPQ